MVVAVVFVMVVVPLVLLLMVVVVVIMDVAVAVWVLMLAVVVLLLRSFKVHCIWVDGTYAFRNWLDPILDRGFLPVQVLPRLEIHTCEAIGG